MDRRKRDQLVAVDDGPEAVDREHPVAVAVERERDVILPAGHLLAHEVEMGGAAALVDVAPVGLVRKHSHLCVEPAKRLGRRAKRRAVGAVQEHADTAQVEVRKAHVQLAHIILQRAVEPAHPADPLGRCQRLAELGLDLVLGVVAELEPVSSEELDSVVLVRIVGRRKHNARIRPE